tara:strand:+ start:1665 stop:1901 length:237 start_codon:yes stop_codon:yes gene_type:complete
MSTKKILDKIETIQEDIHNIKMSHKLMENDLKVMKENHWYHTEKSLATLWKWSLFIGTLIILMFVDEVQTIIYEYILK